MKIEMALPSLTAAGMEVMVARMACKLARRGHDVGVTCILEKGALADEVAAAGVRVSDPGAQGLAHPRWLRNLVRHFRSIAPDVVHIHSGAWFKAALAARLAGVRNVVYTAHGYLSEEQPEEAFLNRIAVKLTTRVVSVSDDLAQVLGRRQLAGRQLAVITNGIDVDVFTPRKSSDEIRRRFGIAPETMLLGTVARLEVIKNQALLIDGVAQARSKGADCAAVLIGEGSLKAELEARAAGLGIGDRVHFWGLERQVARLYPEFDVFTLTSDAEGTSISLLEAMASGVCPIATNVGGNPAVVGEAGVLVPAKDADALADAIVGLGRDSDRRAALGHAARARVVAGFSDEAMLDAYERLYAV